MTSAYPLVKDACIHFSELYPSGPVEKTLDASVVRMKICLEDLVGGCFTKMTPGQTGEKHRQVARKGKIRAAATRRGILQVLAPWPSPIIFFLFLAGKRENPVINYYFDSVTLTGILCDRVSWVSYSLPVFSLCSQA